MYPFVVHITPRFYETDALGHINNATLAAWFEVARTSFVDHLMEGEKLPPQTWMLASVQMDYLQETFFGSPVELRVVAADVGNTSLSIFCEIWQSERLNVKGKAVLVHIDQESRRPVRVPEELRAVLVEG